jgi:prepilin-type N-terminal cleavage/methylation domain-containing protein
MPTTDARTRRPPRGFTLIEILIVVVILGLLAAITVPLFVDSSDDARMSAFVSSLKIYQRAESLYRFENSEYLVDSSSGEVPAGFADYIDTGNWTSVTPIGGVWDTEFNDNGVTSALGVHFNGEGETRDDAYMQQIDAIVDDGNLGTGGFRRIAAGRYYAIIAD